MASKGPADAEEEKKQRLKVLEKEAKLKKKLEMIEIMKLKKKCDKRAHDIVLRLIEPNVDTAYLLENAKYISPRHFEDVYEERKLAGICGWTLCDKKLGPIPKQLYSIRSNKVLDLAERKSFCSPNCYAVATNFKLQLLTTPLWIRDKMDDEMKELNLTILESPEELHGIEIPLENLNISVRSDSQPESRSDIKDDDDEPNTTNY